MYERFVKTYVQIGTKWTNNFNRLYIIFCPIHSASFVPDVSLNIYSCFIPLLIYFVTTGSFQY